MRYRILTGTAQEVEDILNDIYETDSGLTIISMSATDNITTILIKVT